MAVTARGAARGALLLCLGVASLGCRPKAPSWECIAPANPGGGWDLTCRSLAAIWERVQPDEPPMRVTNVPGAGGGVAFAHTVAQRSKDPHLIVAASPSTTLRLAQDQFGSFAVGDVRWVAALATDYGVVAVRADAPWRSLTELVEVWRRDPGSVVAGGGSSVGGQDHMKVLLLAKAAGVNAARVRYVPFDGGGEAMTTLLGGFVDFVPADATESLAMSDHGSVRVLATLAPSRTEGVYAHVPTARELGYPVDWVVWRGFYVPADAPEESYQTWLHRLASIEASAEWAEVRRRRGLAAFFLSGPRFEAFVREQVVAFREMSREVGLLP